MNKKRKFHSKWDDEPVDLREIDDLIEKGLNTEEISEELGIPKGYVEKLFKDLDKDY